MRPDSVSRDAAESPAQLAKYVGWSFTRARLLYMPSSQAGSYEAMRFQLLLLKALILSRPPAPGSMFWLKFNLCWGGSSAGRAPRSQCGGREFDPHPLHHHSFKGSDSSEPFF